MHVLRAFRVRDALPEPGMLGAWVALFLLIASHALLETGRDALFLASLPATRLPIVYLLIAAVAVVFSSLERRSLSSAPSPRRVAGWFVVAGIVTAAVGLLPVERHAFGLYALYVGSGLSTALLVSRFWSMLGGRFSVPSAKRLYTTLGTATGAGAVAGYAAASVVSGLVVPRLLVVGSGLLLLGGAAAVATVSVPEVRHAGHERRTPVLTAIRGVATHRYAATVALFVGLSAVAGTLVDFLFKSHVAAAVEPSQLATFLGEAHLALNVVALIVQALVVRRVLRRGGVTASVGVLPLGLVFGAVLLIATGGLGAAIVLFSLDGTLRHSLHRTVIELLYVPMPQSLRTAARSVVDVVSHRFGQALAAAAVLLWTIWLPASLSALLLAVVGVALLLVAVSLKHHYLQVFRETLRAGVPERTSFPDLDLGSLESVVASLDSPDDARVLAALDMLSSDGRGHLVPSVLLYHPSDAVVLRTVEVLVRGKPAALLAHVDRVLKVASPAVAAALVSARSSVAPDRAWLAELLGDPSDAVRTAAAVELSARGWVSRELASAVVERTLAFGSEAHRSALAEAVGRGGTAGFEPTLLALLDDPAPAVRAAAVHATGKLADPGFVEPLVLRLGDRAVRDEIRATLPAFGDEALAYLRRALGSPATPPDVRDQLPRCISGFGTQEAAGALIDALLSPVSARLAQRIVRELERMRCVNPSLALDPVTIRAAIQRALRRGFEVVHWRLVLTEASDERPERGTPVHGLLLRMLRDKELWIADVLLRLVGLLLPGREIDRMRAGLRSEDLAVWSSSFELLESVLPASCRSSVLALMETVHDRARPKDVERYRPQGLRSYEAVLRRLSVDESQTLSELAERQLRTLPGIEDESGVTTVGPRLDERVVPPTLEAEHA